MRTVLDRSKSWHCQFLLNIFLIPTIRTLDNCNSWSKLLIVGTSLIPLIIVIFRLLTLMVWIITEPTDHKFKKIQLRQFIRNNLHFSDKRICMRLTITCNHSWDGLNDPWWSFPTQDIPWKELPWSQNTKTWECCPFMPQYYHLCSWKVIYDEPLRQTKDLREQHTTVVYFSPFPFWKSNLKEYEG